MRFLVKVRVDPARLAEFGGKLQRNELDRSAIRSDTWCLKDDPAVGYSVWETEGRAEFDRLFAGWRPYYSETEGREVVSPAESMQSMMKR
jgi:hypothetical protein